MDPSRRTSHVKHPILRLEVLGPDGARTSTHRVFCRLRRESVEVGICCACVHCDAIQAEPAPSVDCTVPSIPEELEPDPAGERTEVGTLLSSGTMVVDQNTSLRDVLGILRTGDRRSIAVVDREQILVGVVHEMAFAGRRSCVEGTSPLSAPRDLGCAMSTAMAVHEAMPVRAALRVLAASHLREATVVTSSGAPLGIFRDVDGLMFLARGRH